MLEVSTKDDLATTEEVQDALASLSKADLLRLGKLARHYIRGIPTLDPQDLLHEAVVAVLQGGKSGESRRWPKKVNFLTFLANVMKSIASHHRRQHVSLAGKSVLADKVESELFEESHEAGIIKFQEVEREMSLLLSLFKDDHEAAALLQLLTEGATKTVIFEKTGMTEKQYEAARKRIRRKTEHLSTHRKG